MSTDAECPALTLVEETGVDSPHVLRQTKTVYDSMLTDKWRKQAVALLARKQQLDVECNHIAETAGVQRAMEYGVRAQEALNRMRKRHSEELRTLQDRYQQTLDIMIREVDSSGDGYNTSGAELNKKL
ncbi:hypothetical protein LSAT2_007683 [Lamellibrachia satsuma]|nr:hypothetical protein LSAT2_007683 [Lamellibrachia satsuma]